MVCIPRKMNGHGVEQRSTVPRHLTGQKSLHYRCHSAATHKDISAITIRHGTIRPVCAYMDHHVVLTLSNYSSSVKAQLGACVFSYQILTAVVVPP